MAVSRSRIQFPGPNGQIVQQTREETLADFDAQAQNVLMISGEEFLRRLDAGELDTLIDDPVSYPGITYLLMLSEIVR